MRLQLKPTACLLLALGAGACRTQAPASAPSQRLAQLRETHDRLNRDLEESVAGDALLANASEDTGQVAVGLGAPLVKGVFEEVARRYLDHVVLDLVRDIHVREGGEVKTKTFLGTVKAGDWKVDLTIHRIRGVFRARAPRAELVDGGRVRLGLGIVLENGGGETTLHFRWDASGVAGVVCRDFEVKEQLTGIVLPDQYPVSGSFLLSAGTDTVMARPQFPDKPFRLRTDMTEESWQKVRKILESQDTFFKCGIALDPDAIMPRLKALTTNGFDLRLPRTLFRPVELPASLRQSVQVEEHAVDLSVKPNALKVTPEALWLSASIRARPVRAAIR